MAPPRRQQATFAVAPSPAQTEPDPPSAEEAAAVLSEAWSGDPEWGLMLWLTMLTGLRRGEVSAIRWQHVDFVRGLLRIQRSNAQPKDGIKEKETKTRQQRRVALDPHTIALLATHRERCEHRCQDLNCALDRDAFVFSPAPDGSVPWPPRSLTQRYNRAASRLKIRSTRLHSLRHYSATELIAAGIDVHRRRAPRPWQRRSDHAEDLCGMGGRSWSRASSIRGTGSCRRAEQVDREGEIADSGEPVGVTTHHLIEAEDLMNHHQTGPGPSPPGLAR